jgi:hypothetical protein
VVGSALVGKIAALVDQPEAIAPALSETLAAMRAAIDQQAAELEIHETRTI